MIFFARNRILALDIDESQVVAREFKRGGMRIALGRYLTAPRISELAKDPSIKFKDAGVVISIPTQMVFSRSFAFSATLNKLLKISNKKKKEKELLTFVTRQNLPVKLEECYWAFFLMHNSLNLVAARKEIVERHIQQVEALGLRVEAVVPSLSALYNALIYTYPKNKNRYALLNIKNTSSDLVIYESKRLWMCPISLGMQVLKNEAQSAERFALEVQRAFNSYYLQNPVNDKNPLPFYVNAAELSQDLAGWLKKSLGDVQISCLEALKNISLPRDCKVNRQESLLSMGLGLSYFRIPGGININLIHEKVARENLARQAAFFKAISLPLLGVGALVLVLVDYRLVFEFFNQQSLYKMTETYVARMLPELKSALAENERYAKPLEFLRVKMNRQMVFLSGLAAVAQARPKSIEIRELSAEVKEAKLQVFISGSAPTYEDINEFLKGIKQNKEIIDTKVIASSTTAGEDSNEPITFKLRFDIPAPLYGGVKPTAGKAVAVKKI